jgi:diacylglycerol kinase family enzyme
MRGFGGMISFRVAGGIAAAKRVAEATELFFLAESLGGVESLIEHPGIMTHASVAGTDLEVPDDLLRCRSGSRRSTTCSPTSTGRSATPPRTPEMGRPRALLLFNPNATTTDDAVRDVIASALASAVDLSVQPTKQRGHATHLAAGAVHEGVDVVFALGGDGTANEVLQALAGTPVKLGIIPGGGANVFARALGLPNDAVHATSVLLDRLREGRSRSITLGRAGGRYFGFNAGYGFDAAVIRHVEQHAKVKRTLRQGAFLWSVAHEWSVGAGREGPTVTVELPDGRELGPVAVSMIGNTDPYTYLGPKPMRVHPQASFEDRPRPADHHRTEHRQAAAHRGGVVPGRPPRRAARGRLPPRPRALHPLRPAPAAADGRRRLRRRAPRGALRGRPRRARRHRLTRARARTANARIGPPAGRSSARAPIPACVRGTLTCALLQAKQCPDP